RTDAASPLSEPSASSRLRRSSRDLLGAIGRVRAVVFARTLSPTGARGGCCGLTLPVPGEASVPPRSRYLGFGRRYRFRQHEVDQADAHDDEEQQPGDGRRFTEVLSEECHLPEVENGGLELPLGTAGRCCVEHAGLDEDLQATDRRR